MTRASARVYHHRPTRVAAPSCCKHQRAIVTARLVGLVVGFVRALPSGPIAMACVHPMTEIDPLVRSIMRDQGKGDLEKLEERIRETLREEDIA